MMPPEHPQQSDTVLTEHLQDQFVAWFVGVMAVVYLVESLYQSSEQGKSKDKH